MSFEEFWVIPSSCTVKRVIVPVRPDTLIEEGYGELGVGGLPVSSITIRELFEKIAACPGVGVAEGVAVGVGIGVGVGVGLGGGFARRCHAG
ncbi:MAG TPA: hypothetical protein DC054_00340 [Blastocatellia bacterium]|nr:hypothetical protein [Blastocatellia bacterium]